MRVEDRHSDVLFVSIWFEENDPDLRELMLELAANGLYDYGCYLMAASYEPFASGPLRETGTRLLQEGQHLFVACVRGLFGHPGGIWGDR